MYKVVLSPNNRIRRDSMKKKEELDENTLKFEIAEELGLADKIRSEGWAGLTAKESGRIGGIMTSRKRKEQKDKKSS